MGHFHYRRHFGLLAAAVAALFLLSRWEPFSDSLLPTFALCGALHAAALVLALRVAERAWRKIVFIGIAAACSAFTLYVGIIGFELFAALPGNERLYLVLALCSGSGAITYGSLLRLMWVRKLSSRSVLAMALVCVAASLIAFFAGRHILPPAGWWLAAVWWFSFSGALWYLDSGRDGLTRAASHP